MKKYFELSKEELTSEFENVKKKYDELCALGLNLNMARGKPGNDDLVLSHKLLDILTSKDNLVGKDGIDCRNYGGMDGLTEIKELFSQVIEVPAENIIVGGNSSLTMMFDTIAQGMVSGLGDEPWLNVKDRKFLCPCPGYDRHFGITQHFGFELISIPMTENGPDMDMVEEYVKDKSVKGIWCVPKYSNPTGITYSDETVKRLAGLKPAANDFHIFWDNAYVIHDLYENSDKLLNITEECEKAGNPDMPIIFASTSKITFPGAGVAVEAGSKTIVDMLKARITYQSIGPDKINQLRHAKMFPDFEALKEQMKKHADVLRPKFDAVLEEFRNSLEGLGIASWSKPNGGYFISLDVLDGCAKRVGELCKNAGLVLTTPGATFPYGKDPDDKNLRIAPSYPDIQQIKQAANLLSVAVKYASLEKLVK